jgi:hypothetical protein
MTFARTIQGRPWAPCPQCPRRAENGGDGSEGACPSRRHLPYCDLARTTWIEWRDAIRTAKDETRPDPPSPPEPAAVSPIRKAINFAAAATAHVAAGLPEASAELVERRLAICHDCENYRPSDGTCGGMAGCGCYVAVKATWAEQACPVEKWPTVTTQESF